jgi:hypothetical protein
MARTEKELINEAIAVQDACNLSGVVRSFAQALSDLRDLPDCKGTAWLNQHRVSRLFADKIKSLTGDLLDGDFSQA